LSAGFAKPLRNTPDQYIRQFISKYQANRMMRKDTVQEATLTTSPNTYFQLALSCAFAVGDECDSAVSTVM
jgi:hypothetical protein